MHTWNMPKCLNDLYCILQDKIVDMEAAGRMVVWWRWLKQDVICQNITMFK